MLIDVSILRKYRDFRLIYFGQLISLFGTMMTGVALPLQIYKITSSSFVVGSVGVVELAPLIVCALYGGALADAVDRRRVIVCTEVVLCLSSMLLVLNSLLPNPSIAVIFAGAFLTSAASGFHRPALDASIQRMVDREELPALSALQSLRWSTASIIGPAMGGLSVALLGYTGTYLCDALSFLAALVAILLVRNIPQPPATGAPGLNSVRAGIDYAISRPELVGTYSVDIIAMLFAMPVALFPAIAAQHGMAASAGLLYSAFALGSIVITVFSGWVSGIERQGAAVIMGASIWGLGIIGFGLAPSFGMAFAFLLLAGAGDTVSAIFRQAIWNQTIPSELRGRLAGIEMLSYLSGPHLGNARAGLLAALVGVKASAVSGGVLCLAGCTGYAACFPALWRYSAGIREESEGAETVQARP